MKGTKLVLIIERAEDGGRKIKYQRLDTSEEVPKENIRILKQPPLIFHLDPPFNLPIYVYHIRGFREKANALLVGGMMGDKDNLYYSAAYCKI